MKKVFFLLFNLPLILLGQYSDYYKVDINSKSKVEFSGTVNVNKNVNVSGNVNNTVTTIDYGALSQANAMRQRNAIEKMKIQNENDRQAMLAIANDPSKAFDFGTDNNWKMDKKFKKSMGTPKEIKYMYHKIPHKSLFLKTGAGYNYTNEDDNGVITELIIYPVRNLNVMNDELKKTANNLENAFKYEEYKVGELNDFDGDGKKESYLHKKDINKSKVAGKDGFFGTLIFEDDYEIGIRDSYASLIEYKNEKYLHAVIVKFKGDKDNLTFEDLEGRRYYLKKFLNKTISTIDYK